MMGYRRLKMRSVYVNSIIFCFLFAVASPVLAEDAAEHEEDSNTYHGVCLLPPYPENGIYVIKGVTDASPGQELHAVEMTVTCKPGYTLVGEVHITCLQNWWSNEMPECLPFCVVEKQTSVVSCEASARRCVLEPSLGASGLRSRMHNDARECGMLDPEFAHVVIGGRSARSGELPWHVAIYQKTTTPYMQICGGSIISKSVIISAAHCFWDDLEKLLPASQFTVGVGKRYRSYNNDQDLYAQKTDVREIKIPARFQGSATNFQDDIALVIVASGFTFDSHVKPVCLDFDYQFDAKQLQSGNLGTVGGWGLTAENGNPSPVLKIVEMPYVSIENCITDSQPGFRSYITSDKICAGYVNGTAVCKGDSGGGLAFPKNNNGRARFYLRGIVSTAPNSESLCNAWTWATFTHIVKHEHFIKSVLPEASFMTVGGQSDSIQSIKTQAGTFDIHQLKYEFTTQKPKMIWV